MMRSESGKIVTEPERRVPVRREVSVLVCGGGAAGAIAALAAAKQGASVALIEHHGFLGGVNTAACVNGVGGWQYDLDGRPLISGLPLDVMLRIAELGGGTAGVRRRMQPVEKPDYRDGGLGCYWLHTEPEATKLALDRMMAEAGVDVLLHAQVAMPIMDGNRIQGAFVESKNGREAILADVVVDCTGDGDIAARAGAGFAIGRPEDGACQPMTKMFSVAKSNVPSLWYGDPEDDPEPDPLMRNRFEGAISKAREEGEFVLNPNDIICAASPVCAGDSNIRSVNFTRVQGRLSCDANDLSAAEVEGREQVREAVRFMRKYVPGCEDASLLSTAPQIGIRESRRITGDYELTGEDVRGGADFDDAVARGIYLLDIHNPSDIGKPSALILLDAPYSIPYRCLLPKGIEGLLVAGRCISGDHIALASYRVQSHCMAIGQAAGTAAALASRGGVSPRGLSANALRLQLQKDGANVGPEYGSRIIP